MAYNAILQPILNNINSTHRAVIGVNGVIGLNVVSVNPTRKCQSPTYPEQTLAHWAVMHASSLLSEPGL